MSVIAGLVAGVLAALLIAGTVTPQRGTLGAVGVLVAVAVGLGVSWLLSRGRQDDDTEGTEWWWRVLMVPDSNREWRKGARTLKSGQEQGTSHKRAGP